MLFPCDVLPEFHRNIWLTGSYFLWREGSAVATVKFALTFLRAIRFIWISEYLWSCKIQISLWVNVCLSFVSWLALGFQPNSHCTAGGSRAAFVVTLVIILLKWIQRTVPWFSIWLCGTRSVTGWLTIRVCLSHFLFLRTVLNLFERAEYFKLQFSSFSKEGCKTQWARSFTSSLQLLLPCFWNLDILQSVGMALT